MFCFSFKRLHMLAVSCMLPLVLLLSLSAFASPSAFAQANQLKQQGLTVSTPANQTLPLSRGDRVTIVERIQLLGDDALTLTREAEECNRNHDLGDEYSHSPDDYPPGCLELYTLGKQHETVIGQLTQALCVDGPYTFDSQHANVTCQMSAPTPPKQSEQLIRKVKKELEDQIIPADTKLADKKGEDTTGYCSLVDKIPYIGQWLSPIAGSKCFTYIKHLDDMTNRDTETKVILIGILGRISH